MIQYPAQSADVRVPLSPDAPREPDEFFLLNVPFASGSRAVTLATNAARCTITELWLGQPWRVTSGKQSNQWVQTFTTSTNFFYGLEQRSNLGGGGAWRRVTNTGGGTRWLGPTNGILSITDNLKGGGNGFYRAVIEP